jgi:hypothetical protein
MQIRHVCQSCGEVMAVHEHFVLSGSQELPRRNESITRTVCELARMLAPLGGTRRQAHER